MLDSVIRVNKKHYPLLFNAVVIYIYLSFLIA